MHRDTPKLPENSRRYNAHAESQPDSEERQRERGVQHVHRLWLVQLHVEDRPAQRQERRGQLEQEECDAVEREPTVECDHERNHRHGVMQQVHRLVVDRRPDQVHHCTEKRSR